MTVVTPIAVFLIASADWAVLGACLALALATALFIFYIQPDASDLAPRRSKLDQLLERRDTLYDNLRDLRFEFRSGKYAENDYEAMKTSLENEAALITHGNRSDYGIAGAPASRDQARCFRTRRAMKARCAAFLALGVLLLMPFSFVYGATVHGTVKNGTTGKPAADVEVILIQLQGGMQPVLNSKTDAQGQFTFDYPSIGAQPMLVRAVYQRNQFSSTAASRPERNTSRSFRAVPRPQNDLRGDPFRNFSAERRDSRGRRRICHQE